MTRIPKPSLKEKKHRKSQLTPTSKTTYSNVAVFAPKLGGGGEEKLAYHCMARSSDTARTRDRSKLIYIVIYIYIYLQSLHFPTQPAEKLAPLGSYITGQAKSEGHEAFSKVALDLPTIIRKSEPCPISGAKKNAICIGGMANIWLTVFLVGFVFI